MLKKYYSSILLFSIIFIHAQTVTTQFGTIQGVMNGNVYQFLGIPFAKPPVGNLRWKAPQNPDNWSDTLSVTNFPPVCPQKNFDTGGTSYTITGNEDCLYLNVWTPQINSSGNLPVLVFIHGGGNQQGSSSEQNAGTYMYFGKNMSERGNSVIVTIQYRLGPLGFLVHPGLESENPNNIAGNYAVMDQILALNWVKNNISNFGGDANKVMIFGESAGGVNVGNLLISPMAANLFQRACIESAAPVVKTYASGIADGITYADSYISSGTNAQKIAFMRTLSSNDLVANEAPPLSGGAVGMNWTSVIDNYYFTNSPTQVFQSENFNKVPLLLGSNADEMSLNVPGTVTPGMVTLLKNTTVPNPLRPQADILYPSGATNAEAKQSYIGILTDSQFTATCRRTAQCVSVNQTQPVYRYFFTFKHTVPALYTYGSYHGMELFYVFNTWENATLGSGSFFHTEDGYVQNAMLNYWVNFANSGNPNGANLVNWPQYNSTTDNYLEINAPCIGTQSGLRTAESNLWDSSVSYTPCTSSLSISNFEDHAFTLYPNPVKDELTIDVEKENIKQIYIFDSFGKKVLETENQLIKLNNFPNGIYLVVIKTDNQIYSKKIIKQ